MKPFSQACENNRNPILAVIKPLFRDCKQVLEIGSGTGQHAVYFAENLPHLIWHTGDLRINHNGISQWLADAALPNVRAPLAMDVTEPDWPQLSVDAVFSANTAHIMAWSAVKLMIAGVAKMLPSGGIFVIYGPFNYAGAYTSASNENFDRWLKERDPLSGIREFEAFNQLAEENGMSLQQDCTMPANNRLLCWRKN